MYIYIINQDFGRDLKLEAPTLTSAARDGTNIYRKSQARPVLSDSSLNIILPSSAKCSLSG